MGQAYGRSLKRSLLTSSYTNARHTQRLHARAAFYADKLVTLGQSAAHRPAAGEGEAGQQSPEPLLSLSQQRRAEDVLLLAKAYHQGRDYRRAVHTLDRHGLLAVKVR